MMQLILRFHWLTIQIFKKCPIFISFLEGQDGDGRSSMLQQAKHFWTTANNTQELYSEFTPRRHQDFMHTQTRQEASVWTHITPQIVTCLCNWLSNVRGGGGGGGGKINCAQTAHHKKGQCIYHSFLPLVHTSKMVHVPLLPPSGAYQ